MLINNKFKDNMLKSSMFLTCILSDNYKLFFNVIALATSFYYRFIATNFFS